MPTDYLIAHKVRGELAFDIAQKIDLGTSSDPGPWWIIPTSGHRAYPFWWRGLENIFVQDYGGTPEFRDIYDAVPDLPANLRDHYAVVKPPAPNKRKLDLDELNLEELGLL